jgi:hypothetical protein
VLELACPFFQKPAKDAQCFCSRVARDEHLRELQDQETLHGSCAISDHEAQTERALGFAESLVHDDIGTLGRPRIVVLANASPDFIPIHGSPDVRDV